VRLSYLTGFRVPTAGQLYSLSTQQWLQTVGDKLYPRLTGRLSPLNPVAKALGAQPLRPERSKTWSGGVVWRTSNGLSGSVDAYQVRVMDRLSLSPNIDVTAKQIADLVALGVSGADSYTTINWFTNDYSTRTRGIDATLAYTHALGLGHFDLRAAYNYNSTKAESGAILLQSMTQKRLLEEQLPQHNATFSGTYRQGRIATQARVRYYGPWTDVSSTDDTFQEFGGIAFFDLSADFKASKNLLLRVGAENIFNTHPDQAKNGASRGVIYSRNSPYDIYGGRYYARLCFTM